jgi:hypothetical protein
MLAGGLMIIVSVALAVLHAPEPLLALMVTLVVPAIVGVPEITFLSCPFPNDKPAGNGAAV